MNQFTPVWTPAMVDELKRHWIAGLLSASQIAKVIGVHSKNCVIGKAHKLNLPKRKPGENVPRVKAMKTAPKLSETKLESERRRQLRVRDARRKKPRKSWTPYIILNNIESRKKNRPLPSMIGDNGNGGIPFMEIGRLQCHYVLGEPVANALMCGAPTDGGRYCAHHHAICFVPTLHNQDTKREMPLQGT